MCAVSAVGDGWRDRLNPWQDKWEPLGPSYPGPNLPSIPYPGPIPGPYIPAAPIFTPQQVSREEFEVLKNLVLEMKKELVAAKQQDIANNEPDCEMEDKVALLKKIAKMVGVSLEEVFGK